MTKELFTSSALLGHAVSVNLAAKLVDRGIISASEMADVMDEALLYFESFQAAFPENQADFEEARRFLDGLVATYRGASPQK